MQTVELDTGSLADKQALSVPAGNFGISDIVSGCPFATGLSGVAVMS